MPYGFRRRSDSESNRATQEATRGPRRRLTLNAETSVCPCCAGHDQAWHAADPAVAGSLRRRDGRDRAPERAALRPRGPAAQDVVAPPYDVIDAEQRAAAAVALALQRGRDRPPRGRRGPLRARPPSCCAWRERGRPRDRRAAGAVGARAGLHRARRPARTRRGFLARVRVEEYGAGPDPPARANAPGAQGGPAALDPRHQGQPVADLLAVLRLRRGRLGRARPAQSSEPWAQTTDDDGTVNRLVARDRRGGDPAAVQDAERDRAADRRRPPPLRDRPRLRG